jgi:hypothetical protein
MEKDDLEERKFMPIHDSIQDLEFAVGIVFASNVQPELIPGAILKIGEFPSWNPEGKDEGPRKFYARHFRGVPALYAPFQGEMYAELILRRTDRQSEFLFGRRGEKGPFTFRKDKDHLPLRVYRNSKAPSNWCFKPLFIRAENNKGVHLIKISIDWLIKDRVRMIFLDASKPPSFLSI